MAIHASDSTGPKQTVSRLMALAAALGLAAMIYPTDAVAADSEPCPIPHCVWDVGPTCRMCTTINGNYVMYKTDSLP